MTATYYDVQQVYGRNYGSERLFKRNYCSKLLYTEGLMDFQQTLNAYWVIDNMVSYMSTIEKAYNDNGFTFFVVEIALNQQKQGYMEVYTEDYVEGIYNEYISIIKQNIPFIDLPTKIDDEITSYKFFLQLSSVEPVNFTMILTSEY